MAWQELLEQLPRPLVASLALVAIGQLCEEEALAVPQPLLLKRRWAQRVRELPPRAFVWHAPPLLLKESRPQRVVYLPRVVPRPPQLVQQLLLPAEQELQWVVREPVPVQADRL